jgi:hypothetical protein
MFTRTVALLELQLARSVSAGGITKFPVLEMLRTLGAPWPDRRP